MLSALTSVLSGVVGPALEKYFDFKGKEQQKTIKLEEFKTLQKQIEAELKIKLEEEMNRPDSELRQFALDYEGKASEMPRAVQIMRGSVRPLVTYWSIGLITWIIFSAKAGDQIGQNMEHIPNQLWWIFLAVFGFWFGGRAIENVQAVKQKGQLDQARYDGTAKLQQEQERTRQEQVKAEVEKEKTRQIIATTPPATAAAPQYREPEPKYDPWKEFDLD